MTYDNNADVIVDRPDGGGDGVGETQRDGRKKLPHVTRHLQISTSPGANKGCRNFDGSLDSAPTEAK